MTRKVLVFLNISLSTRQIYVKDKGRIAFDCSKKKGIFKKEQMDEPFKIMLVKSIFYFRIHKYTLQLEVRMAKTQIHNSSLAIKTPRVWLPELGFKTAPTVTSEGTRKTIQCRKPCLYFWAPHLITVLLN